MSLLSIPLDKIDEAEIQRLLSMGVAESPYLDYKRETYGDNGDQRSEYLADISSFANTLGGDLVIGVVEIKGSPTALTPFAGDCDAEKRRLEQMALSGLEPRVSNLRIHSVPIAAGGTSSSFECLEALSHLIALSPATATGFGREPARPNTNPMLSSYATCSTMPRTLPSASGAFRLIDW